MAKVKNVSGYDRTLPGFGLVEAGEVITVEPGDVYGLTCQADNWTPADADATKAHNEGAKRAAKEVS